jgi:hypothetical protein
MERVWKVVVVVVVGDMVVVELWCGEVGVDGWEVGVGVECWCGMVVVSRVEGM